MREESREAAPLTPKRRRFVEEYLVDLNGTQAAIRAGYSSKTANEQVARLMANHTVSFAVREAIRARSGRVEISQDYVLTRLKENVERALQHRLVVDSDGLTAGIYSYNGAVANRALELLGRHLGLFTDKIEHAGGLTLENLLALSRGED